MKEIEFTEMDIGKLIVIQSVIDGKKTGKQSSDVLRGKVSEPTISTILHICEGANITLKDFFDSKLFDEVEAVERCKKS